MKLILKAYNVLFLITTLIWLVPARANDDPKVEKKKSYSKSYPVSSGERITLSNQFGEMKLITWDKNEVKVDASITAKADDEQRAQQILDKITIEDGKGDGGVYFKTKLGKDEWNGDKEKNRDEKSKEEKKSHHNEGMEINYTVYLPAGNPLTVENQFGPMTVPDYRGEATVVSKFGSLTAGKISNAKSVTVEFGKADIAQMDGGKLVIKFSRGSVNKLSGDVNAQFEFCDKVRIKVDNDVKDLDVKNSYSTVYVDLDKNFSGNYSITTSYGELKNKTNFTIREKEENDEDRRGPRFDHQYSGTSGSGSTKVKIRSSFGEVVLGHDLQVDMTERQRSRGRTRSI